MVINYKLYIFCHNYRQSYAGEVSNVNVLHQTLTQFSYLYNQKMPHLIEILTFRKQEKEHYQVIY